MDKVWDQSQSDTRIKLCEFEALEATYEASFIGADFLGFHIFSDQDVMAKAQKFKEFFTYLPPTPIKTLLTDLPLNTLFEVLDIVQFDAIQLYNHCSREDIKKIRDHTPSYIKILKVMSEKSAENGVDDNAFIARYDDIVDAFLLDSFYEGGTGMTGDWEHSADIVRQCQSPVFLAGGLTADNVQQAIAKVRPFGVDVENGVSDRMPDGRRLKNMLKCRLFIEKVRTADWQLSLNISKES
jgi:phosphoribosylanthranilate isomerase